MAKLKSITENSWIVLGDTDDTKIGLLTENHSKYVLMSKGIKQQFLSKEEVNIHFNENVFDNVIKNSPTIDPKKEYFINGYPTDFPEPHEVILKGHDLPLFSKKKSSDVYYSAGYYCVLSSKTWMPVLTPKLSTLLSYTYQGPYRTELEVKQNISRLRKEQQLKFRLE